jgi:hypothetical protein
MYMGKESQFNNPVSEYANSYCAINNIYLNGVRIAAIMPVSKTQYYLTDQVDSVRLITNDAGKPLARF